MTSSLLVQDQTQKRPLRHHRFVTIATAVKKKWPSVQEKLQNISESLKGGDTLFFSSLISTQFLFLSHWFYGFENIPVCNYPNLNVILLFVFCLLLFSTPGLLYFRFESSAYGGACLSICDSVGVMAGKFGDRFWPPSNCCHIEIIWVEETLMSPAVAQKNLQANHFADPIGAMNETWKSLIRRQSFTNSGFVSLPTRRVDGENEWWWPLVYWYDGQRTQLPCRNAPQIYFLFGVPFRSSKGFFSWEIAADGLNSFVSYQ